MLAEYAALLKSYGITRVIGDRYGGMWPRERFAAHGIEYVVADKTASDYYLVLLCHKFGCLLRAAQHGQRESVVARAATNLRRIVAIEFGTWRSGRNGGSSGLVTFA